MGRNLQERQQAKRPRGDLLTAEISRWQESQRLRSYAPALLERAAERNDGIEPTDKVALWAAWISGRADQLDPLVPSESSILNLSFEEYEQGDRRAGDDRRAIVPLAVLSSVDAAQARVRLSWTGRDGPSLAVRGPWLPV